MIRIRVLSFNGVAPAEPLEAEFDELGGTIGRADTNLLALHDPDRCISRLQARVDWRAGAYELTNLGANPVEIEGRSLANGERGPLRPGQRIVIGRYVLEIVAAGAPADASGGPATVDAQLDPLGLFGAGAGQPAAADPFAEFLSEPISAPGAAKGSPAHARASELSGQAAKPGAGAVARSADADARPAALQQVIPDDFDPFAEPMAPPPLPKAPAVEPLDSLGFGEQGETLGGPGINTMFGLGQARTDSRADPFAGTPLSDQPADRPNAPEVATDPLAALFDVPPAAPPHAPVADHVPEIHGSFQAPTAKPAGDTFLSWELDAEQSAPAHGAELPPGVAAAARAPDAPAPSAPQSAAPAEPETTPAAPVAASGTPADNAAEAGAWHAAGDTAAPLAVHPRSGTLPLSDDLMKAFLEGLGIADPGLPATPTPELMHRIGLLLREATQGTLELLLARALMKREVRAEVTMIVSRDNNPLKFSPNAEVALAHLLAPRGQGFLGPVEAMRDAYGDLRAHQFGFMAGMRAALAGVLERFDPQTLEKRLSEPSMLDNLLPINRRARLWGLYTELYRDIASEAEDDFQVLFGRAFLRAYEEQVRRMEAEES